MADRNIIEFESEGFDWRNVVLDDEMSLDSTDGQLIHPCHHIRHEDDDDACENHFAPLTRQKRLQ
jgi:hypothetical protein